MELSRACFASLTQKLTLLCCHCTADAAGPAAQRLYDGTHVLLAGRFAVQSYLKITACSALQVQQSNHRALAVQAWCPSQHLRRRYGLLRRCLQCLTPATGMHMTACAYFLQHSYLGRTADVALGVALPLHSHVAINSVLSDYVPKSVRGAHTVPHDLPCGALA